MLKKNICLTVAMIICLGLCACNSITKTNIEPSTNTDVTIKPIVEPTEDVETPSPTIDVTTPEPTVEVATATPTPSETSKEEKTEVVEKPTTKPTATPEPTKEATKKPVATTKPTEKPKETQKPKESVKPKETPKATEKVTSKPKETEKPKSDTWVRNKSLENQLFNDLSKNYTNKSEYDEIWKDYSEFSPEQIATFDSICEDFVAGKKSAKETKQRLVNAKRISNSGDTKGIMSSDCDVLKVVFDSKNISTSDFKALLWDKYNAVYPTPNYMFIKAFYNEKKNETNVYFVRAKGCFLGSF